MSAVNQSRRINDLPPVKVAPLKSVNKRLRSGYVSTHGNIVNIAKPEQIAFIWLMSFRRERVSEKQKQIYLIAGNSCAYLLRSALRAAQISLNVKSRCLLDHFSRSTRSTQVMT